MRVMNQTGQPRNSVLSAECSRDKPPFSFVGKGFDNVEYRLGVHKDTDQCL